MSENNKKILGILPHSIGGRLTISSVFDGFRQNGFEVEVFDELKQENFLDFIKEKNYEYLIGYDFSGLKLKVDNNLDVKTVNYFSDVIETKASGVQEEWEKYKETIPQILKSEYLLQLFKQDNELGEIISRNKILNNFLTKLKNLMTNKLNDEDFENELDKLVIDWEKDKKKSKAKLEKDIESNGEWQGLAKLNYRIKNAQNLVREIMEGLYKC